MTTSVVMNTIESATTNLVLEIRLIYPEKGNIYFNGYTMKKGLPRRVQVAKLSFSTNEKYHITSNDVVQTIPFEQMSMDDVYFEFTTTCIRALHVAEDILTLPEKGVK